MIRNLSVLLLLFLTLPGFVLGRPVAWWGFDEGKVRIVKDRVSGEVDEIHGNYWYAEGVSGSCLKLDGYATHVARLRAKSPRLGEDPTVVEL